MVFCCSSLKGLRKIDGIEKWVCSCKKYLSHHDGEVTILRFCACLGDVIPFFFRISLLWNDSVYPMYCILEAHINNMLDFTD